MNSLEVGHGQGLVHEQSERRVGHERNRRQAHKRIVLHILVERFVGRETDAADEQRIAIRLGARDEQIADVGVRTGPVHHDETAPERLGERLGDDPSPVTSTAPPAVNGTTTSTVEDGYCSWVLAAVPAAT